MGTTLRNLIVVRLRKWEDGAPQSVAAECGAVYESQLPPVRLFRVKVPDGADPDAMRAAFSAHPKVELAGFDSKMKSRSVTAAPAPTDPGVALSDGFQVCHIFEAWSMLNPRIAARRGPRPGGGVWMGDPNVLIGTVDTGVMSPTLFAQMYPNSTVQVDRANVQISGQSGVVSTAWPESTDASTEAHGHATANIIAGPPNNGIGSSGICPDCTFGTYAVDESTTTYEYITGYNVAVQMGLRIISCSNGWELGDGGIGGDGGVDLLAVQNGAIMVVAADNFGVDLGVSNGSATNLTYKHPNDWAPAEDVNAISVGGTDDKDLPALWFPDVVPVPILPILSTNYSGNPLSLSIAQFLQNSLAPERAVFTATLGSLTTQLTVVRLQAGTDGRAGQALVGYLSNEYPILAADSSGNVTGGFAPASGVFHVFNSLTEVTGTASCAYSVLSQTGMTVSIDSTGTYTITGMTADTATAVLQCLYTFADGGGSLPVTQTLTVVKSRGATTAATAPLISLSANGRTFTFDVNFAASPTSQSVTVTPTKTNVSGNVAITAQGWQTQLHGATNWGAPVDILTPSWPAWVVSWPSPGNVNGVVDPHTAPAGTPPGCGIFTGTSCSTPVTAAIMALIWSWNPPRRPPRIPGKYYNVGDGVSGSGYLYHCTVAGYAPYVSSPLTSPSPVATTTEYGGLTWVLDGPDPGFSPQQVKNLLYAGARTPNTPPSQILKAWHSYQILASTGMQIDHGNPGVSWAQMFPNAPGVADALGGLLAAQAQYPSLDGIDVIVCPVVNGASQVLGQRIAGRFVVATAQGSTAWPITYTDGITGVKWSTNVPANSDGSVPTVTAQDYDVITSVGTPSGGTIALSGNRSAGGAVQLVSGATDYSSAVQSPTATTWAATIPAVQGQTVIATDALSGASSSATLPANAVSLVGEADGVGGGSGNPIVVLPLAAFAAGAGGAAAGQPIIQPPLVGGAGGQAGAAATLTQKSASTLRTFAVSDGASSLTFGTPVWNVTGGDNVPTGIGIYPSSYYGPASALAGGAGGHAGATATPGVIQGLAGAAPGHAGGAGALPQQAASGEADAHGAGSGKLGVAQPLAGEADAHAGATATGPQTPIPIAGEADGSAAGAGANPTVVAEPGTAVGRGRAVGVLTQQLPLSGRADGDAEAAASEATPVAFDRVWACSTQVGILAGGTTVGAAPLPTLAGVRFGMGSREVFVGDDVVIYFMAKDAFGNPIDVTNATLYCDAVLSGTNALIPRDFVTVEDGPNGIIAAHFNGSTTASWARGGQYNYDGRIKTADGRCYTIGRDYLVARQAYTPTP